MSTVGSFACLGIALVVACSPDPNRDCAVGKTDFTADPSNCGFCGNVCGIDTACIDGQCIQAECQPGVTEECYGGGEGTLGVGPCVGGVRTCGRAGQWSRCDGEVAPVNEDCSDGVDNDCNGMIDDNVDADGDGFFTCIGAGLPADCCDSTGVCSKPELVNGGAFDAAGNHLDDDCDGIVDNTILICDQNLSSNSTSGMDFARAIDICQVASPTDRTWGVLDASITLADGTGVPDKEGYAIRQRFGTNTLPQGGVSLALISSGGAAAKGDLNPGYHDWVSYAHVVGSSSGLPPDWLSANGNALPNAPGCTASNILTANDPVMLTFRLRVPTNAKSFKLSTNFYSAEYPEYTCSPFNDFFVVLLDSTYTGMQPNPIDKNLAVYQPMGTMDRVPVGVNLAYGNTGLFTQCVNGITGCSSKLGSITTCTGTTQLAGTGFDDPNSGQCDPGALEGGATGWLVTAGNVTPGEIITLRVAVWDTGDPSWDSLAVVDGFQWSTELAQPGTVIFRGDAPE